MSMSFRYGAPEDLEAIGVFLSRIYGCSPQAPLLQPRHMYWKYFHPHPEWEGSRSFLMTDGERIIAHLAAVPSVLLTTAGPRTCAHFIDWAADPLAMGAGAALLRRLMRKVEFTFCIGGSIDNQRLLPVLGFRASGETHILFRPLRPLRQAWLHPARDLGLPARVLRNAWWSAIPIRARSRWHCEPSDPEKAPEWIWHLPQSGMIPHRRSVALVRYFLASPCEKFQFYLISDQSGIQGAVLFCFRSGQARVADLWIANPSVERLRIALEAAMRTARNLPIEEFVISVSTHPLREAAALSGLKLAHTRPIMSMPAIDIQGVPIDTNLGLDDASYLGDFRIFYYS